MVEERLFRDEFDSDDETDVREILDYVRESHTVLIQDAGEPCYILNCISSGSTTPPITISSWTETSPAYKKTIWERGGREVPPSMHPDLREYTNEGSGSVEVWIDGARAERVMIAADIEENDQFSVIKESTGDVVLVFATGLDLSATEVVYRYPNLCECVSPQSLQPSEQCLGCYGTAFDGGYTQYSGSVSATPYVRFPSPPEELGRRGEFGDTRVRRTTYWMEREPRVQDRDIFIGADPSSPHYGRRFRVINWVHSSLAGFPLHQKFEANEVQRTDIEYRISVVAYTVQPPEEVGPDD